MGDILLKYHRLAHRGGEQNCSSCSPYLPLLSCLACVSCLSCSSCLSCLPCLPCLSCACSCQFSNECHLLTVHLTRADDLSRDAGDDCRVIRETTHPLRKIFQAVIFDDGKSPNAERCFYGGSISTRSLQRRYSLFVFPLFWRESPGRMKNLQLNIPAGALSFFAYYVIRYSYYCINSMSPVVAVPVLRLYVISVLISIGCA